MTGFGDSRGLGGCAVLVLDCEDEPTGLDSGFKVRDSVTTSKGVSDSQKNIEGDNLPLSILSFLPIGNGWNIGNWVGVGRLSYWRRLCNI